LSLYLSLYESIWVYVYLNLFKFVFVCVYLSLCLSKSVWKFEGQYVYLTLIGFWRSICLYNFVWNLKICLFAWTLKVYLLSLFESFFYLFESWFKSWSVICIIHCPMFELVCVHCICESCVFEWCVLVSESYVLSFMSCYETTTQRWKMSFLM